MADEPKTISKDDHLKAFALAVLANEYSLKAYEVETTLKKLLGFGDDGTWNNYGHVSDMIFASERATSALFEEALRRAQISVASDG